ncbi:MAG: type II secretion system F family protein [Candidatus Alkaliphilus sp. MAG34]|nr:type II secretion system F family protein [Clostridiales bacterium]
MTVVISLVAGILFYYLINGLIKLIFGRKLIIQNRLEELQGTHTWDKSAVIDRPFGERLFGPTLKKIINFFALLIPMNENTYEKLNTQLIQAGISMEARQYRATVLLFITLCASGLMFYGFISDSPTERIILLTIIGIYAGFTISRFYLKSKITGRQRKIYHQFPSVMDLLSVCVTAGLGFDQAISYIINRMEGCLIEELRTLLREISMGTPRNEALDRFAKRCNLEEVRIFVSAVNQAEELGSSLNNILENQASNVRNSHKQRTEEVAQKISVKMVLPMVLFILPVIFIVILGPIVPSVISALGDF